MNTELGEIKIKKMPVHELKPLTEAQRQGPPRRVITALGHVDGGGETPLSLLEAQRRSVWWLIRIKGDYEGLVAEYYRINKLLADRWMENLGRK